MNSENNVLTIKTIQTQPIRNLTTAIKDILTDSTITITRDTMSILCLDRSKTILVDMKLYAARFEEFICHPEKIIICANTSNLHKLLSDMSNDDVLTIYIDKKDYHDGIVGELGLQFDNKDIKQSYNHKLRLLDTETEEMVVPNMQYSTVINLPTSYFQKIIRDFKQISDRIEFKSVGDDLIMSCQGTFATSSIKRSQIEGHMEFVKRPEADVIVQGEFSLKSLAMFTKCSNLCTHLELYLDNNMPLIVRYSIASLGDIKLCLSPLPPIG
jgi:proliferating cell nuclear antigen